jgi:hypothetical protein
MAKPEVTDGVTRISPREKSERKEFLAYSIEEAANALKKILSAGLNRRAIVVLVAEETKVTRGEINSVLTALENLHKTYCT